MGTTFEVRDLFKTENNLHGLDFGGAGEFRHHRWTVEVIGKVALGNIHRTVFVDGSTTVTTPAPDMTMSSEPGGLLALTSNLGTTSENAFAVLPEAGLNLSLAITDCLAFRAGYTVLAVNGVARTGDRIDRSVNTNLVPGGTGTGPARPAALMDATSGLWAQGLSIGCYGAF